MMRLRAAATPIAPARLLLLTRTRVGGLSDPLEAVTEKANAPVRQILAFSENNDSTTRELTGVSTPTAVPRGHAGVR